MYASRQFSSKAVKTYTKTRIGFPNLFFTDHCSNKRQLHLEINPSTNTSSLRSCILSNYAFKNHAHLRSISTSSRFDARHDPSIIELIGESSLVHKIQDTLVKLHDVTGLSWWATVIVAAFTARTVFVLPMAIYQHYITGKLETMYNTLNTTVKEEVTKQINELSLKNGWDSKTMSTEYKKMMRARKNEMVLKNNCHPAKTMIIVLIQAPVWISLSSAFRNLIYMVPRHDAQAEIVFLQLKASSVLWLSDLTLADKTWTIPICLALVNLSTIQVNYLARKQKNGIRKFMLYVMRGFVLLMAYVSSTVPSIISLYWLTSGCYGLCQNLILLTPRVRQFLGIPFTKGVHVHPLQHIMKRLKGIVYFFKY